MIPNISSLANLINFFSDAPDNSFKVYEMGRRIYEIPLSVFTEFEQAESPWPTPLMQSAWFAICITANEHDNFFWFLKFPLDEQGMLIQASRDEYIEQFIGQIDLSNNTDEKAKQARLQETLEQESPYGFKPSDEKLANINAIVKTQAKLAPSQYFEPVREYLTKDDSFDQWEHLGYQGLADYCSKLTNDDVENELVDLLINKLDKLPQHVLNAFATCLEHHSLPANLITTWLNHIDKSDIQSLISGLRVISLGQASNVASLQAHKDFVSYCLTSEFKTNVEVLAAISGRDWELLTDSNLMNLYLEALSENEEGQQSFNILAQDLMFLPGMRQHVLEQFRNPNRSDALIRSIGFLYATL